MASFWGFFAPPLDSADRRAGATRLFSSGPSLASYSAFVSGCEPVVLEVEVVVEVGVDADVEVDAGVDVAVEDVVFFDELPQPARARASIEAATAARDE